jgi:hypothetical protein
MTADDTFERRLAEALFAYAGDAPVRDDPMRFAADIAAGHPRGWLAPVAGTLRGSRARVLWLVALLLLTAAVGAALVGLGAIHLERRPLVVGPRPPLALFGQWQSERRPGRILDLNAPSLFSDAAGLPLDDLGAVVAFDAVGGDGIAGTVTIRSSSACGDGTYRVAMSDPFTTGPTAAPLPSAIQAPLPLVVFNIRFVEVSDSCSERETLLANEVWSRASSTLRAGETYGSLQFGEPFHMTLPPGTGAGLFSPEIGAMYQDRPNRLHFSHAWWNAAMIDDAPVYTSICHPELGTLPDIPGSMEAVEAWLQQATDVTFERTDLTVDGRPAVLWRETGECAESPLASGGELYAIPTGDDVILFAFRGDTPNESLIGRAIVLALRFD